MPGAGGRAEREPLLAAESLRMPVLLCFVANIRLAA
jgi:hypothetical protein